MMRCNKPIEYSGIDDALRKLISAQLAFGRELVKLTGAGCNNVINGVRGLSLPLGESCCQIPEPCWMPVRLGELCCQLSPDGKGDTESF